jgi:hypothetical protein
MSQCKQIQLFGAGVVLGALLGVGISWAIFSRASTLRDEEDARVEQAMHEMLIIKKAYETFYTQQFRWPQDRSEVYPLLEKGKLAFQSPWPDVLYQVHFLVLQQVDGVNTERPLIFCHPPGKPVIVVPDLPKGM